MDAGVRNRGDPDFVTKDLWLLDKIQDVCKKGGFDDPLPNYKSQYRRALELGECTAQNCSAASQCVPVSGSVSLFLQHACSSACVPSKATCTTKHVCGADAPDPHNVSLSNSALMQAGC